MSVTLLPFQEAIMPEIDTTNGRSLLALPMGSGKTVISGHWLASRQAFPAVVVCPAFLKRQWRQELSEKFSLDAGICSGTTPSYEERVALRSKQAVIVNYEIVSHWLPFLKRYRPKLVIADEVHMVGNLRAARTRAWLKLCEGVKHLLCLSGTPLVNYPFELFPILHALRPDKFKSAWSFGFKFCKPVQSYGRWKFTGAAKIPQLHALLVESGMIRRTKEEVLPDLPSLTRSVVPLEIEKRKEYGRAEADVIGWLAETNLHAAAKAMSAVELARFTHLKVLAAKLKLPAVRQWLDSFLRESDGKLLVGCLHREIIYDLEDHYARLSVSIHGGKTQKQRQQAEDAIRQDPNCRLLFGQMKACGLGLNLPEVTAVAVVEFPWNWAVLEQFIARCHRLTSTAPVHAYYLAAANTIETKLCQLIGKKAVIGDKVLDGESDKLTVSLVSELAIALRGNT